MQYIPLEFSSVTEIILEDLSGFFFFFKLHYRFLNDFLLVRQN
jgi:hypothetical protein